MYVDGCTSIEETTKKGRRPSFGSGGIARSCSHCFEGPRDRTNVITIPKQVMKVCRELRIRRGPDSMTSRRKAWASMWPATHRGPDQANVIIVTIIPGFVFPIGHAPIVEFKGLEEGTSMTAAPCGRGLRCIYPPLGARSSKWTEERNGMASGVLMKIVDTRHGYWDLREQSTFDQGLLSRGKE
jgi:hypothetical protein